MLPIPIRSRWSRPLSLLLLAVLSVGPLAPRGGILPTALVPPVALAVESTGPSWIFQGPAPQLNAQQDTVNVSQEQESVSGAVTAIATSPTNADLVYLGSANGGVWKSTNATAANPTWLPLTDNLRSLSIGIGALALDPTDPTGQTVLAGTGRYSGYANIGDDLVGLYYTNNGGSTWTTISTGPSTWMTVANITGVAVRGNTLLAAADGSNYGLFRTTGGPAGNWTELSGTGILPKARASSIVGDPANPNRLYVTFTGASGGIFRTDDLGNNWTNVSSGITAISSSTTAFNAGVFNNGSTSVVSVVLNGTVNGAVSNAIYRSVNGGAFAPLDVPMQFQNTYNNFQIAVDKTNPDVLYVGGGYIIVANNPFLAAANRIDASKPSGSQITLLYGGVSTKLSAAINSTATTLTVGSTSGFPATLPFPITIDSEQLTVNAVVGTVLTVTRGANGTTAAPHSSGAVVSGYPTYGAPHVDINYLATDAAGGLLLGTHGSLYRLPEPGRSASATNYWTAQNGNLAVSEIHSIAYDPVTHTLIAGLQDNCVVYQTAPGSTTWAVGPSSGDGGDVAVGVVTLPSGTPASTSLLFTQNASWNELYVASTTGFPAGGMFYITVNSEQMFVSAIRGAAYQIASASQSGNTVTITTATPHGLTTGNSVNIRGVSVGGYNAALVTVASVPSSTSFTYNLTTSGLAPATGGIASNLRLAVARGLNGTTAATHNSGSSVTSLYSPALLAQPVSVRYGSSQSLGGFKRQMFTAANTMIGSVDISVAVITDKQFTHPIAVNAVEPQRLLLGGSANLYESLNMGDTIAQIAQIGVNQLPGPIAYGGYRNGVANPDVLYIGKGATVYARTQAGSAVAATAALPMGASTVRRVVMNPSDWSTVFASDNNQVFVSSNGGGSWGDVTGGLLSLGAGEIWALEYVPGPAPYLAVGTRSGVFASLISNLGTWTRLGSGLPDTLAFELDYDPADDVLAVGMLGRSAWALPGAAAAFTPSNVAPILSLSGPASVNEGAAEYSYTFSVNDPGDRFTVSTPTISGGSLVAGSLTTSTSGGSFRATFPDGPASASISLQVTDSTGLTSNAAALSVTVANQAPVVAIIGAPTSGSPGTPINLSSTVSDVPADVSAGFLREWLVQKSTNGGTSWGNYASGSAENFSYTPDVAGIYRVFFRARDKDNAYGGWVARTINAASPDLAAQALSLTVSEGQATANAGTYAHHGPAPLTLSASSGVLAQTQSLFSEAFENDAQGGNLTSLANWLVTSGNVDVFPTYPGQGNAVDLDGSPGAATIRTKTTFTLQPGTYRLTFKLGANNAVGNGINGVRVTLGSALDETFASNPTQISIVRTFTIASAVTAPIIFSETGASDGGGSVVDDVQLSRTSAPFGQPATLTVLGYWQLGEDDPGAADGQPAANTTLGQNAAGLNAALNLTRNGSPSYLVVDGSKGSIRAVALNGSSDSYTRASAASDATDNFGVEAWVRPSSAAGTQVIVYNGNTSGSGFGLTIEGGVYRGLYGGIALVDTGIAPLLNQWTHIALVRDNGVNRFFVNGVQAFSNNTAGPLPASTGFAIGQAPQLPIASGQPFAGAVDDVRLFTFTPGTFSTQDLGYNARVQGNWTWDFSSSDGPADSSTVTVTATTGAVGDTSSLPFLLTVENIAPTGDLTGGSVAEGSVGSVSFSNADDPSAPDRSAGFRYAYDFDNDGVFEVGDGSYSGSVVAASAVVPANFLADGPGARTIRARIIDKDGAGNDYTTTIAISNAPPTATLSGPSTLLASQIGTFVFRASDPSPIDQTNGFTYTVDWDDGTIETIAPVAGNGDATLRHAYAGAGNYTVQVVATDNAGAASSSTAVAVTVAALTSGNLQSTLAATPAVALEPANDAALQSAVAAVNGVVVAGAPAAVTINLGAGPYSGVTLSPPSGITLALAGNYTAGGGSGTTMISSDNGPAITVGAGEVYVQGCTLATSTDTPTVLVTGGHIVLGESSVQESSNFANVAVAVRAGRANFGFDLVINVNGEGAYVSSYTRRALIPHPEGIDAELSPNLFQKDGVAVNAAYLSSTALVASAPQTLIGREVTFTATVDVNALEHGHATGNVDFFDGQTLLGSAPLARIGGLYVATFSTTALSEGKHTIRAIYGGDQAYVASEATRTHEVVSQLAIYLPVALK